MGGGGDGQIFLISCSFIDLYEPLDQDATFNKNRRETIDKSIPSKEDIIDTENTKEKIDALIKYEGETKNTENTVDELEKKENSNPSKVTGN